MIRNRQPKINQPVEQPKNNPPPKKRQRLAPPMTPQDEEAALRASLSISGGNILGTQRTPKGPLITKPAILNEDPNISLVDLLNVSDSIDPNPGGAPENHLMIPDISGEEDLLNLMADDITELAGAFQNYQNYKFGENEYEKYEDENNKLPSMPPPQPQPQPLPPTPPEPLPEMIPDTSKPPEGLNVAAQERYKISTNPFQAPKKTRATRKISKPPLISKTDIRKSTRKKSRIDYSKFNKTGDKSKKK